MTEQLKFIITELNRELGTSYDLIKFDSLNEVQHLQVLVDLLANLDAGQKFDLNEEEPEAISVKLLDMIRNVKYRPDIGVEISLFRKNLLTGERTTVFSILEWLLKNSNQVKKTAYLAKFLIRPDIPNDILGNADMAELLEVHDKLVEEFKESHRHTASMEQNNPSEVINDIKEMAMERDIVIKRLEVAQLNLSDISNKETVLSTAKSMRIQQEKSKKLTSQLSEQKEKLKRASDQLQRNLGVFRGQTSAPRAPGDLIQKLNEELKVNEYLAKDKLPLELSNVRRDVELLQNVHSYGHVQRENLLQIQEKIDNVNKDIESLVQKKLALTDPHDDKLAPFRHQAAIIKRNKEAVAEKLEELKNEFRELEAQLSEKQLQVQKLLGDTVLRGEELKKYVNKLRTKSNVYKKQRSTLSSLKTEVGVLSRTLEILQTRDTTLELALLNHKKLNINLDSSEIHDDIDTDDLSTKTPQELSQIIVQISGKLNEVKQDILPISNHLKPLKEEYQQLQQQYDQKKRVYDSTSINLASQMEPLDQEVADLQKQLESKEDEWKVLRQRIEKAEQLLSIIEQENVSRNIEVSTPRQPSRLETLQMQIHQQEKQAALLKEEQKFVSERQSMLGEQSMMWNHLLELLECKIQCMDEAVDKQGSVTITKQSQTLIL